MQQYITYENKIDELILDARHPQSKNKVFILVEGEDDLKLYGKFFNDICKIEPIPGGVIKLEQGLADIPRFVKTINLIGIRDADFLHIEGFESILPNLFLTDTHDTETMMIASDETFCAILHEFSPRNTNNFHRLKQDFLKSVEFLGYLRWYSNINSAELNFKGFNISTLLKEPDFTELRLISAVIKRSPNATITDENEILFEVNQLKKKSFPLLQICCGHDVVNVIAAYITGVNEARISSQLRTAFNFKEFEKTDLYQQLNTYAQNVGLSFFK